MLFRNYLYPSFPTCFSLLKKAGITIGVFLIFTSFRSFNLIEEAENELSGLSLEMESITKGIPDVSKIYGKIKFVTYHADYKVKVVDFYEDLKVQLVKYHPDKPGKWQIVDNHEDFKIKYVEHFPGTSR